MSATKETIEELKEQSYHIVEGLKKLKHTYIVELIKKCEPEDFVGHTIFGAYTAGFTTGCSLSIAFTLVMSVAILIYAGILFSIDAPSYIDYLKIGTIVSIGSIINFLYLSIKIGKLNSALKQNLPKGKK